ncbi:phd finger protein, putative [Plasmodium chabaudi chabaudi]|uniref:EELM2 domain-containing protein, putative n=2 Tax=Plasmodium chabaudi TaxID=5825 RepID=A0A077TMJ8_PLACU|nr:EELM2 domain-containing protein, putative [Plasmodium chabaudi chabaudi]SCM01635.1 phd finger protein, putative [Plasmodium chabaudi chabaudi]SCM08807.1 phd finger protein, putative [Plasmodium chabaudi adami]VTZ67954.1 EELM2 domain-containing protein, putative [Plasmodium chabaudi chabaudi]|eukprot:XP_016653562.1 phd finger protein, putative [Plasmodium chabaudi chabaudi]
MEKGLTIVHNKIKRKEIDKSKNKNINLVENDELKNHKNGAYNNNEDKKVNNKTTKNNNNNSEIKNYSNLENDSFCYECYHGGNLICCDNCIRSYHIYCVSESDKPQPSFNYWFCPLCKRNGVSFGIPLKRKKKIRTLSTLGNTQEKVKQKSEGTKYAGEINVGENYQVSNVSTFFLNSHSEQYDEVSKSELVYSPYLLERMKESFLCEGQYELVIKNDYELAIFIKELAKNWKCQLGWHPFTPEYAFKILHRVDYNPKRAIELLKSSDFNFLEICDPPIRKYENKWRPRDKRGQISDSPYPSSELLQSYIKRSVNISVSEKKYNYYSNGKSKNYCEINKNNIIESSYPHERTRNGLRKELEDDDDSVDIDEIDEEVIDEVERDEMDDDEDY